MKSRHLLAICLAVLLAPLAGPAAAADPDHLPIGSQRLQVRTPPVAPGGATIQAQVAPKALTTDAAAGSVMLDLDDRVGLGVGDVLRIGVGALTEYATISALPGTRGPSPDAGTVVLAAHTRTAHSSGDVVQRQSMSAASGAHHPAFLLLAAEAGDSALIVSDDNGFTAGDVVRVTLPDEQVFFHELVGAATAPIPRLLELREPLSFNHESGSVVAQRTALIEVQALDAGGWGNRLRTMIEDEPGLVSSAQLTFVADPTEIELSSLTGVEPGTVLELSGPNRGDPVVGGRLKVTAVNRSTGRVTLAPGLDADHTAAIAALPPGSFLRVRSREFRLTTLYMRRPDPLVPTRDEQILDSEQFLNLSMDPRHSRYFVSVIGDSAGPLRLADRRPEGGSWYIRVSDLAASAAEREQIRLGPEVLVDLLPSGRLRPARHALTEGDGRIDLLDDDDYIGSEAADPEDRTGLHSLQNYDEISIVLCPGRTGSLLQGAVIAHCERMRYRFAILDGQREPNDSLADIRAQRQQFDTKYAGLYHPWLLVAAPFPTAPGPAPDYPIPPSGHMAGIYARTDIERGVHKAPANEVVRGVVGLQRSLNKGEHDILNPYPVNVNVIRDFRRINRGIRVWGGRVITSDSDWKYVNVRRLLIFIEASIDRGLQWVVFEPNAEPLWARVRRAISNFLTVVWRNGALEGTTTEEAFFVKCDRTTMTQTDIDNGRLIVVIGVAPVKPAEFVIIRIGLWTAHAET